MNDSGSLPIGQHNVEILENRAIWQRKPTLRAIYQQFYRLIATALTDKVPGATVELGSGMGNIKELIPDCVTTDIFENPWLDRVETAYVLSFPDASVANLIMFDVFHHLEHPGRAFREVARVVRPGGRLVIFDQDMGLIPRLICRAFHHEPVALGDSIAWEAPVDFAPGQTTYYAATGNAYRCFVRGELAQAWSADWKLVACRRITTFAWLGCGGFRGPQLYPDALLALVQFLDRVLSLVPTLFSARLLVVLERRP